MQSDNKKNILFHWLYSILVLKDIPKSQYTMANALQVLAEAKIVLPVNEETKVFFQSVVREFKQAEDKEELIEQHPLPEFIIDETPAEETVEEAVEAAVEEAAEAAAEEEEEEEDEEENSVEREEVVEIITSIVMEMRNQGETLPTWRMVKEHLRDSPYRKLYRKNKKLFKNVAIEVATQLEADNAPQNVITEEMKNTIRKVSQKIIDKVKPKKVSDGFVKKVTDFIQKQLSIDLSPQSADVKVIIEDVLASSNPASFEIEDDDDEKVAKKDKKPRAPKEKKPLSALDELRVQHYTLSNQMDMIRSRMNLNRDFMRKTNLGMGMEQDKELKNQNEQLLKELEVVKAQFKKVDEEIFNVKVDVDLSKEQDMKHLLRPIVVEEDKQKKSKTSPLQKLYADDATRPARNALPKNINNINMKYLAFLSQYAFSPLMITEDPSLQLAMSDYSISQDFITQFLRLNPRQRYEFIGTIFTSTIEVLVARYESKETMLNGNVLSLLNSFVDSNVKEGCDDLKLAMNDEIDYNLMYYFMGAVGMDVATTVMKIVNSIGDKYKCDLNKEETLKSEMMKKIQSIITSNPDVNVVLSHAHQHQVKKLKELVKEFETLKFNEDDVRSLQQIHEQLVKEASKVDVPEMADNLYRARNIRFMDFLPAELISYGDKIMSVQSVFKTLSDTFANLSLRNEIYKAIEKIQRDIQPSLKKSERKQKELERLNTLKEQGEIIQPVETFIRTYIELYDTVNSIPASSVRGGGMIQNLLSFNRLTDFPLHYQEEIRRNANFELNSVFGHNEQLFSAKKEKLNILNTIEIHLRSATERRPVDKIKIAELINRLDDSEDVKNQLLYIIQKGEYVNIYQILDSIRPGTKRLRDPLHYEGIRRAQRMNNLNIVKSEQEQIRARFPKMSYPLRQCLTLQYNKPWLNLPRNFSYYLSDANNTNKDDMSDEERFLFGSKLAFGNNLYTPTTIFWKVFCTNYFNNTVFHLDKVLSDFTGKDRKFVLGVYSTTKLSENEQQKYTVDGKFVYRALDEADYVAERDFIQKYVSGAKSESQTISEAKLYIDLESDYTFRKAVRGKMVELITRHSMEAAEKITNFNAKMAAQVEGEIYSQTQQMSMNNKVPLYNYLNNIYSVVVYLDKASPLYEYSRYFKRLYFSNPVLAVKMTRLERIPEVFLGVDVAGFQSTFDAYVDKLTLNKIAGLLDITIRQDIQSSISALTKSVVGLYDANVFKNVCINYDDIKDKQPFIAVPTSASKMYCLTREELKDIVEGNVVSIQHIPEQIKKYVQTKINLSTMNDTVFLVKTEIEYFVEPRESEFMSVYIELQMFNEPEDLYEALVVKDLFVMIEKASKQSLSEKMKQMVLEHAMAYTLELYFKKIQMIVMQYIQKNDSKLRAELQKEYVKRLVRYSGDKTVAERDNAERKTILMSLFEHVEKETGGKLLLDSVEDAIIQFVSTHFEGSFSEKAIGLSRSTKCSVCSKRISEGLMHYKTSYLQKNEEGKYIAEHKEFCTRECFEKYAEEDVPSSTDAIKGALVHVLIQRIIEPKIMYDDLNKKLKELNINVREGSPFMVMYKAYLMSSANVAVVSGDAQAIEDLCDIFGVKAITLSDKWVALMNNEEFKTVYLMEVEQLVRKEVESIKPNPQVVESPETFSSVFEIKKSVVQNYIKEIADSEAQKVRNGSDIIVTFNFKRDLFDMIFNKFQSQKKLRNLERNYKISMTIKNALEQYIRGFIGEKKSGQYTDMSVYNQIPKSYINTFMNNVENKSKFTRGIGNLARKLYGPNRTFQDMMPVLHDSLNELVSKSRNFHTILAGAVKSSDAQGYLYNELVKKFNIDLVYLEQVQDYRQTLVLMGNTFIDMLQDNLTSGIKQTNQQRKKRIVTQAQHQKGLLEQKLNNIQTRWNNIEKELDSIEAQIVVAEQSAAVQSGKPILRYVEQAAQLRMKSDELRAEREGLESEMAQIDQDIREMEPSVKEQRSKMYQLQKEALQSRLQKLHPVDNKELIEKLQKELVDLEPKVRQEKAGSKTESAGNVVATTAKLSLRERKALEAKSASSTKSRVMASSSAQPNRIDIDSIKKIVSELNILLMNEVNKEVKMLAQDLDSSAKEFIEEYDSAIELVQDEMEEEVEEEMVEDKSNERMFVGSEEEFLSRYADDNEEDDEDAEEREYGDEDDGGNDDDDGMY